MPHSVKYLGITIDRRLTFQDHIDILISKLSRSIGIICKLKHIMPSKVLLNLYYTMVHPHLLHGISIWGNTHNKHLNRLASLQNKAVKIIIGAQWQDQATPYYAQLRIRKLHELYVYEVAKLMHKRFSKKLPLNLTHFFVSINRIHTRTTRLSSSDLNPIPSKIQNAKTPKKFQISGS